MPQWIWQQPDWPRFHWDEAAVLRELLPAREAQARLLGALRWLQPDDARNAEYELMVADSIGTSAIEGETLNPEAVRSSVARRLGIDKAGLGAAPRHVEGLVELLLDATQHYDRPLTTERLFAWQAALFPTGYSGLSHVRTGDWRGDAPMQVISGPIGMPHVHFEAPPRAGLEQEMAAFLSWFGLTNDGLDGLTRAALAHFWFVTLHPFEDGNGRLARAITDMALAQAEKNGTRFYSLSARIQQVREDYYDVLEKSQRGTADITEWIVWFLRQVQAACKEAEVIVARILDKARFWQRHAQTELNERQRKVLNRLLDAGEEFRGGMNTRKYVSLCKVSRATAYRELTDLVEKGCLQVTGAGRSVNYRVGGHVAVAGVNH